MKTTINLISYKEIVRTKNEETSLRSKQIALTFTQRVSAFFELIAMQIFGDQKTKAILPEAWHSFNEQKCTIYVHNEPSPIKSSIKNASQEILILPGSDKSILPMPNRLDYRLDQSSAREQQVRDIANLKENIKDIQNELNCAELSDLLQSNKVEDLPTLQNLLKARDTYVVWTTLEKAIKQKGLNPLNTFATLEDLLSIPEKFTNWCHTNSTELAKIKRLNLSYKDPDFSHLYHEYNKLTFLPPEIGNLTNLQFLDLANNKLTSLPPEIGNLTNLESLSLSYNNLTSIPSEIGKLTNLESLSLSHNNLTSLPSEIRNLISLIMLDLDDNNITSLPSEIGSLINLLRLHLSYNNLTSLPSEINNLTKLENLSLNYNNLTSLPSEIGNLTKLKELHLNYNNLTSIPKEINEIPNLTVYGLPLTLRIELLINRINKFLP